MSHLKNNYIFEILESRPTIWHTFKQISSTFNFWSPYNRMGSFWSPVFQNAQWCQSGISLFACQDMSKSKKQQKYCNYTRLPSPKFILLFVNSTIVLSKCYKICFNIVQKMWPSTTKEHGSQLVHVSGLKFTINQSTLKGMVNFYCSGLCSLMLNP